MKMQKLWLVAVVALAAGEGCKKTANGDLVVKRPSRIDVTTTADTVRIPSVHTKTDTVNEPVVGVQKETVIIDKPVVGTKRTKVKVPVTEKH